jgi:hypothetical protein
MSRIRVALGDVQSAMLRDILAEIAELQPDMELVAPLESHDLKEAVALHRPDVLICDIRADELPAVCRELFAAPDAPLIVGLAREGRETAVCLANAGAAQLMSVIRTAVVGREEGRTLELVHSSDAAREAAATAVYTSSAECLNDQLRILDLALLAEVDAFEATIWDEGAQRLQGLAIAPDEVRALLQASAPIPGPHQGSELRQRRLRLAHAAARRIATTAGRPDAPPLVRLVDRFALDPFEQFAIVAALAGEIDRNKYSKAYALLQDDVTRKQPSLELLLRVYGGTEGERWEAARAFDTGRPLRRWNLLRFAPRESGDPATPFGRRLELDDRIARFLLGLDDLGPQLDDVAVLGPWDADVLRVAPDRDAVDRLARLLGEVGRGAAGAPPRLVVHVHGRPGTGRRALIANLCERRGLRLVRVDAARLASLPSPAFEDTLLGLARESALHPVALCLEHVETLLDDDSPAAHGLRAIMQALRGVAPVTFLVGQRAWTPDGLFGDGVFQSVQLDLPDAVTARDLWTVALRQVPLAAEIGGPEQAAVELSGRFRLSAGQIHDAVAAAQAHALWETADPAPLTLAVLYRGCREQCSHRLASLARHVTTEFGWDDLVLPERQRSQLHELERAIRNATGVLEDWNFQSRLPYGRGITALFSGPSGTGKTMAAGILARELGLDLYKIDLSRVVSKYIGETEKNLERIFQQAEDANAMLFFDEADALFGKRSAIKDAHDRYANIEIAYLLQKMEERLGVTILATNLRTNMDEAFVRRIRFGIEFLLPEYPQRLAIWRSSLPKEIRLADDVDLPALAKRLRVSGGSIMNVCISAASLAYEPGGVIAMTHFAQAARRELQKLGHQYHERDFQPSDSAAAAMRSDA